MKPEFHSFIRKAAPRVAVLIPCFNEALTIRSVVLEYRSRLPHAEIYVYDNNSTDGTAEIAEKAGAIVRSEHQQGKGFVVRRMFREIEADVYLLVDGDRTYPADPAPEMIRLVAEHGADMVIAERLSARDFRETTQRFHAAGNHLIRALLNLLFRAKLRDILTGCRAFSRQFVKTCPILSDGFSVETELSIHAVEHRLQVETVPVRCRQRPPGSLSKLRTFTDGSKVLRTMLRMYILYHPVSFLSVLCAALAVLSMLFPRYLAPASPVLALLSSAGVALANAVQSEKRAFELQLLNAGQNIRG